MSDEIRDDMHGRIESFDQSVRSLERRLRAVERRLSIEVPPEDAAAYAFDTTEVLLQQTRTELSALVEDIGSMKTNIDDLKELVQESMRTDTGELPALVEDVDRLKTDIGNLKELVQESMRTDTGEFPALVEDIGSMKTDIGNLKGLVQESMRMDMDELSNSVLELSTRLGKAENRNKITIGSMKVPIELSGVIGAGVLLVTGSLIFADRWDIIRSPYFSFGIAGVLGAAVLLKFYLANKDVD